MIVASDSSSRAVTSGVAFVVVDNAWGPLAMDRTGVQVLSRDEIRLRPSAREPQQI